jgi:hypothetical protein
MAQKLGDLDLKHSFRFSQLTKVIWVLLHDGYDILISDIR